MTVNGIKYAVNKSGKIVTGKWYKIGSKKYYCSKSGRIIRTKKA